MRIVFLAWNGSIHTRRWVRFFAHQGHDVHVITCGDGDAVDHDEHGNVIEANWQVHDLGKPRAGKAGYFFKTPAVRRLIERIEPDVVHAHFATSYGMLALASRHRPLVVTAHGDDVLIAPQRPMMRRLVRRVLRAAELITVPAEPMKRAVEDLLEGEGWTGQIVVFQYGVESRRLARVAAEAEGERAATPIGGPRSGSLRIVSTRAFHQLYRIDVVIDAVAQLSTAGHDVHLDLVGDGPQRSEIERQLEACGLDGRSVTLHGHLPPWKLERLVAAADIYVSVAESDGMSLSLLEAMALGAVPVLSDIPANRPWVHDGETGVLVAINPAAVAEGILTAASLDRARVQRDNRSVVAELGDRDTNLALCERLVDSLVGVEFDPTPIRDSDADADVA